MRKKEEEAVYESPINNISKKFNAFLNVIMLLMALACVLPVILVFIVSMSSEQSIFQNGYTFFPT